MPIIETQVIAIRSKQNSTFKNSFPVGGSKTAGCTFLQTVGIVYIAGYVEAITPSYLKKYN